MLSQRTGCFAEPRGVRSAQAPPELLEKESSSTILRIRAEKHWKGHSDELFKNHPRSNLFCMGVEKPMEINFEDKVSLKKKAKNTGDKETDGASLAELAQGWGSGGSSMSLAKKVKKGSGGGLQKVLLNEDAGEESDAVSDDSRSSSRSSKSNSSSKSDSSSNSEEDAKANKEKEDAQSV